MFSMSYNIVYNISCFLSSALGQELLGFHKIFAAAAKLGQSVVAAAAPQ